MEVVPLFLIVQVSMESYAALGFPYWLHKLVVLFQHPSQVSASLCDVSPQPGSKVKKPHSLWDAVANVRDFDIDQ